jgi:hypothetical protein
MRKIPLEREYPPVEDYRNYQIGKQAGRPIASIDDSHDHEKDAQKSSIWTVAQRDVE